MSFNTPTIVIAEPEIAKAKISGVPVGSSFACLLAATAFVAVSLLSSMYCLLAYIPTTYFAFIQAPFQAWMPAFAGWQAYLFAITFLAIALPVAARVRNSRTRTLAIEFLTVGFIATIYLFLARPVQFLRNNSASFVWAVAFLLPIAVLGALECSTALPQITDPGRNRRSFSYTRVVIAAIFVALTYPGAGYLRYYIAGGRKNLPGSDAIVWIWAVLVHILLFVFAFSIISLAEKLTRLTPKPHRAHFIGFAVLWCIGVTFLLHKVVLASIPFSGVEAAIYAGLFSLAMVTFVAGCVLRARAFPASPSASGHRHTKFELPFMCLLLLIAALAVPALIGVLDWNSVLEKTWAVAYWVLVCRVLVFSSSKGNRTSYAVPLTAAILCLLAFRAGKYSQSKWASILSRPRFDATTALERRSAFDASFSAASELLTSSNTRPCNEQCQFIHQQTNIPATASVDLHNIDLAPNFGPTAGKKPNIFIIVVDSLRQDYVSPYNPAVSFTPSIGAFARESVVFRNAFTRYAGTTLSEPAIWSGMLQLHKHYVQPFHMVNGLEKLIQTDDYQSFISVDTVLRVLLQPGKDTVELDKTAQKWTDVDFCSTAAEVTSKLQNRRSAGRPFFLYTQPQNVHIVTLGQTTRMRPPKKDYAPFVSYYASELERLDGCFGSFIQKLKNLGIYDQSIVVLTSDHGEDLKAFGPERHAFSLKPNVIRIPLIIHVPEEIKRTWFHDPDAVAFNIDITPTLYELLGHGPVAARPEFGRPLFTPSEDEIKKYQRTSFMVVSSYGPLYGLLTDQGRTLFTENETNGAEELFLLNRDPDATNNVLTEDSRRRAEAQIHTDVAGIADLYGYRYKATTLLDWLLR